MWLRKKTQNLPTSCTSCRLNPHDQPGRLCEYGIYKRPLRAPTKENALVLLAVDIGGKNTEEEDQIRIWAVPTAGQRSAQCWRASQGGEVDCDSQRGKGLWQQWLKKNSCYSYVLTCSVDPFVFSYFFSLPPTPIVVVDLIGTMKSNWYFELFFFLLSHIFLLLYAFASMLGFCSSVEFSFFLFSILILIF